MALGYEDGGIESMETTDAVGVANCDCGIAQTGNTSEILFIIDKPFVVDVGTVDSDPSTVGNSDLYRVSQFASQYVAILGCVVCCQRGQIHLLSRRVIHRVVIIIA